MSKQTLQLFTLLDELVAEGILDEKEAKQIRFMPRTGSGEQAHPINYIASQALDDKRRKVGKLSVDNLLEWLSKRCGQPVYHLDPLKVDVAAVTSVMSFAFAQRHGILCVDVREDEILIASVEPLVDEWEKDLAQVVKKPITRVLMDPEALSRFTVEFYSMAKSVNLAQQADRSGSTADATNLEQLLDISKIKDPDANDQHIVRIVDWLLQYAFDQRASDIHIEPRRELAQVRFRIDGLLYHVYELPAAVGVAVTSRLKILGRMNLAEKRRPQDGRLKTRSPTGSEIELRLSTIPTAFGEKLVMRIFDPEVLVRSFRELGLGEEEQAIWQQMTSQPHGIVLVTGPTGSGKTTTLYSTLKQLATPEVNVCTIEDPMEMVEPSFNQMQVQHGIGLDFASGVRALLRQDPDIIMVGEIRDLETAEMAIQAALTGHLVLSTLHTNDSPSAVTRLLELGVAPYLISATVLGVMAQRLVRTLCTHCKQPVAADKNDWKALDPDGHLFMPDNLYQQQGCLECRQTGYAGRQGIYELLPMLPAIQQQLSVGADISALRQIARKEGMKSLRMSGAEKVAAGTTTVEEVLRVTPVVYDPVPA